MASSELQVLSPGVGYGIVIGIGAFFAVFMQVSLGLTYLQNRYTSYQTSQAEEFNTASRSVKPGLIAAGIVSSWTWSATLLTSATFAYEYGLCGGMWYGGMGTFQILLFTIIAIKIKAHAPGAHTFPEIVLARHGTAAHVIYLGFGVATNLLVGACLVLGGSQVVEALTGMNVYAACFMVPAVVAAYVVAGGLRSTFIADYTHTVILFLAIFTFGFKVYATNPTIGSPSALYDLLVQASQDMPIAGNQDGSYLTFQSIDGVVFAFDLFITGFCCVWLDQAYWQRAIASRPETCVKAYIFGAVAWYGIPFSFATMMGLGCAALTGSPTFPTYPNPLSAAQVGAGLSSPATAIAVLGRGGAALMLLLLFMAVTSSTSAELIAVASLITFDVFKTYIKPHATSTELVRISHYSIIAYSLVLGAFCSLLNAVSIDLTWLLTVFGIIVGGGAVPVGLVLLWSRMSSVAAVFAPWVGFAAGLTAWMVTTSKRSGAITIATTGNVRNALAGALTSWGIGFIAAVILSLLFPGTWQNTDADAVERNSKLDGGTEARGALGEGVDIEKSSSPTITTSPASDAKPVPKSGNEVVDFLSTNFTEPMSAAEVRKATILAYGFNSLFLAVAIFLVPFSLYGSGWVFTRAGFTGFCVVSFIWVWVSAIICVVWPIVESRATISGIVKGIVRDLRRRGKA